MEFQKYQSMMIIFYWQNLKDELDAESCASAKTREGSF